MKIISSAIGFFLIACSLHTASQNTPYNFSPTDHVYPVVFSVKETRASGCIAEPVLNVHTPESNSETDSDWKDLLDPGPESGSHESGDGYVHGPDTESEPEQGRETVPEMTPPEPEQVHESVTTKESESMPEPVSWQEPELARPIFTSLPEMNVFEPQYIAFEKDIHTMIEKARINSGIGTPVGVFVMDLNTGFYAGVNEMLTRVDSYDRVLEGYFNSASVIKLFQGYILYDMLRRGELDGNKVYEDRVTGRSFRLIEMIHTMISKSDNNYSNACLRLIGNEKSNQVLNRLGIFHSVIYGEMSGAIGYSQQNNLDKYGTTKRCARITPQDAGLIFYNVYMLKDSDAYMSAMNHALLENIYNTRIPVGVKRVDKNYEVAHKTGTNTALGVYNDAGIVYCGNPYILVVFTQGTTSDNGHTFIRTLSHNLTQYFDRKAEPQALGLLMRKVAPALHERLNNPSFSP